MPDANPQGNCINQQPASRLLKTEHRALVRWLHDDLAQNLVAIKSFAAAIIEQNKERADDTAEIAEIIKQAASNAYRATYDLMQELRAQNGADRSLGVAISAWLSAARLSEKNINHQLHIDPGLEDLDEFTKAAILRSLQTFINYSKQSKGSPRIKISLNDLSNTSGYNAELLLNHEGEFEIAPNDSPAIIALRERIEAIGGEVSVETNDTDSFQLSLRFYSATAESEASK